MGNCKCGCGAAVPRRRKYLNKEHQLDHMRSGEARRMNAMLPLEARERGGSVSGRMARDSGRLAEAAQKGGARYAYVHSAVDAYSRVAYSELLDDERALTCAAFWRRAQAWFADHNIHVERILTDNHFSYTRGPIFKSALGDITHSRIQPRRPQTNGKVERFNRTLLDEWAYVRVYRSDYARNQALTRWLHLYNHHRSHTSLGGRAPMELINNLPGRHS